MLNLLMQYLVGGVAAGFLMLIATFIMTHSLTTNAYGEGMLFVSLINILFAICSLGLDQSFIRYFYEPRYKNNVKHLFYRCLSVILPSFLVVSILLLLCKNKLQNFLHVDAPFLYFLLFASFLYIFQRFLLLTARLKEQAYIYNFANVLMQLLFLIVFCLSVYTQNKTYLSVVISQIAGVFGSALLLFILYRRDLKLNSLSTFSNHRNSKEFKEFLRFGMPSIFSLSLTWVFTNIDKIFILKLSGFAELGVYTAAFALTAPLLFFQSIFNTAWAPRMNSMVINAPFKSQKVFHDTFRNLLLSLTITFILIVALKDLIILFVGHKYQAARDIFPWLLFAPYFRTLSEVVFAGIVKSKKTYWHIIFSLAACVTNIIFCLLLTPIYGAKGAAIAVAISFAVFFLLRLSVSFRFYAFRINFFKLILHIGVLVGFVTISSIDNTHLFSAILCMFLVICLERKWLILWLKQNYKSKSGILMFN